MIYSGQIERIHYEPDHQVDQITFDDKDKEVEVFIEISKKFRGSIKENIKIEIHDSQNYTKKYDSKTVIVYNGLLYTTKSKKDKVEVLFSLGGFMLRITMATPIPSFFKERREYQIIVSSKDKDT